MQGIIMAGGKGQRLEPLTFDAPKPFLPVAGRPVVEWGILSLARAGITDIIITTAYKREVLQKHLGDGSHLGVTIRYAEEETPLGTAGGVKNASFLIEGPFIVMSGDVVADIDIQELIDFHRSRGDALATIALTKVKDPTAYGIVGLDDRGQITRFKEKPQPHEVFSDLTNAGIFVVEPEVLERIPIGTKYDWSKDVWTHMVGEPLYGMELHGYWKDVGHPDDLLEANRNQCARIERHLFGGIDMATDASEKGAIMMEGAKIGSGAHIGNSLLMEDVEIGEGALVEDSIIGRAAKIGARAYLKGCVIGAEAEVPADAKWDGKRHPEPTAESQARLGGAA